MSALRDKSSQTPYSKRNDVIKKKKTIKIHDFIRPIKMEVVMALFENSIKIKWNLVRSELYKYVSTHYNSCRKKSHSENYRKFSKKLKNTRISTPKNCWKIEEKFPAQVRKFTPNYSEMKKRIIFFKSNITLRKNFEKSRIYTRIAEKTRR